MAQDKFTALWVSHSSLRDFLTCPRAYFLRNVYKDPKTNHKVTVMKPPLALGQAVHDVVESLSVLPAEERLSISLLKKFDIAWENVSSKKGGFTSLKQETETKERGKEMLRNIEKNPGPIIRKAVKIKQDLPYYWLSNEDNIILCGKIDWLEYVPEDDSVNILDFKTGQNEEKKDSLQLPIYYLLAANTQGRKVSKVSYWYLALENSPRQMELPDLDNSFEKVFEVARRMKLARQMEHFKCPKDGCFACRPLERVLKGEGELIATSSYNQDIYILPED